MAPKPTVEQLCARYCNENAHSEHVTALALAIFDRVHRTLGIARTQRRVLETAGRLHDIGYAASPRNHARASADIVLCEGVRGLGPEERRTVVAIILLHQKDYRRHLAEPILASRARARRAMKLAAILRIADGLDHSHAQNASISAVAIETGPILIAIRSPGYGGNIAWAQAKADMWEHAFPGRTIHLCLVAEKTAALRYEGVVRAGDTVAQTARKLLFVLHRSTGDSYAATLAGSDPEALHDLRTSLRRLRTALGVFRKHLPGLPAKKLQTLIGDFTRRLGPARDFDVWLQFLADPNITAALAGDHLFRRYGAKQRSARVRRDRRLREILKNGGYIRSMRRLAYYLRIELPRAVRKTKHKRLPAFAAKRILALLDKLQTRAHLAHAGSPEESHTLRKICRRTRYAAEFFAPALGTTVNELATRLEEVADALGELHDRDVDLGRIARHRAAFSRTLEPIVRLRRSEAEKRFEEGWKMLHRKAFLRRVRHTLLQQRRRKK